ncbi:MAG: hypothetical protein GKC10_02900 [Methanosarcinales archaeon]|nr:hypothetical protein [Methanosarcinales archaeon]
MRLKRRDQNILLMLAAVVIVALLWGPLWFLAQLLLFAAVVYFVYQILKDRF